MGHTATLSPGTMWYFRRRFCSAHSQNVDFSFSRPWVQRSLLLLIAVEEGEINYSPHLLQLSPVQQV